MYVGEKDQNGEPHGEGKYTYTNGVYEGQWQHGKHHGKGKYTGASGHVYEGQWERGKPHGQGKDTDANGSKYDGQWQHGKCHGKGKETHADGSVYEGQYKRGKCHGKGKDTDADGNVYEGQFEYGKRHGKGKFKCTTGRAPGLYEGQFKRGWFRGQGKFTYANGNVYVGQWQMDGRHGQGKYTFANGDVFHEGQWEHDKPAAAADASNDAEADGSAPEVGPTRKRGTENGAGLEPSLKRAKMAAARAAKKAAAEAETEAADGGYSLLPRGQHYAQGGVMTIGDARTCLPDAMTVIKCTFLKVGQTRVPTITKKTIAWFAERLRLDPQREDTADPNAFDAMAFADANEFSLTYVPNASPRVLLNKPCGVFLVRLLIHYMHEGAKKIDTHFLVYDADNGKIIDNLRGKGAVVVDASDREDNPSAIRPFKEELFPNAKKVVIDAVYEARPKA